MPTIGVQDLALALMLREGSRDVPLYGMTIKVPLLSDDASTWARGVDIKPSTRSVALRRHLRGGDWCAMASSKNGAARSRAARITTIGLSEWESTSIHDQVRGYPYPLQNFVEVDAKCSTSALA